MVKKNVSKTKTMYFLFKSLTKDITNFGSDFLSLHLPRILNLFWFDAFKPIIILWKNKITEKEFPFTFYSMLKSLEYVAIAFSLRNIIKGAINLSVTSLIKTVRFIPMIHLC